MNDKQTVPSPRTRLKRLARRQIVPKPPLFLPLVHAVAAQIEALDHHSFLTDPTKLTKGLHALHQALDTDAVITIVPSGLEAEALGARLDWSSYPPRIIAADEGVQGLDLGDPGRVRQGVGIATALDVTARLAKTLADDTLLVAALTGPATLARQLVDLPQWPAQPVPDDDTTRLLEYCGQVVTKLASAFYETGADLVLIVEDAVPPPESAIHTTWRTAIAISANMARFHRTLPVLVVGGDDDNVLANLAGDPPAGVTLCLPPAGRRAASPAPHGHALPPTPEDWTAPESDCALITTVGEVAPDCSIPVLRESCQRMRDHLAR